MTDHHQDKAKPRTDEHDNLKPAGDGQAPRPATEPAGGKGSSDTPETMTDPATGEPNKGSGI